MPSRDRNVGAPGQDTPGVSLHPLSGDSPDREPGESFLGPTAKQPLGSLPSLPWSPGLLITHPFPRFTLSTAFFASSHLCSGGRFPHLPGLRFPSAPAASFPRTLSEYITNQPPLDGEPGCSMNLRSHTPWVALSPLDLRLLLGQARVQTLALRLTCVRSWKSLPTLRTSVPSPLNGYILFPQVPAECWENAWMWRHPVSSPSARLAP